MNKKVSKKVAWAAVPVLAVGLLIGGRAVVSAADRQEAQNTAKAYVPADAVLQGQEREDGAYKFRYYSESTGMVYEVEISQSSGTIRELETELRGGMGSASASFTEEQIRARIQDLYPGAEVTGIQLGKDDGYYSYEVYFRTGDQYGSVELNAADGTVLESQVKYGTPVVIEAEATAAATAAETTAAETTAAPETAAETTAAATTEAPETTAASSGNTGTQSSGQSTNSGSQNTGSQNSGNQAASADTIGEERAREIALGRAEAGNAEVSGLHLDRDDGRLVYEGDMKDDSYRYEFEIDAQSGQVLQWEREARRSSQNTSSGSQGGSQNSGSQADASTIGTDAASSIALGKAQAGDARITEIQLEREDGRLVYEGEMRDSSYEYDFEIDACSGEVLKWEVEGLGR